jgi:dTDP-4-dehydrorhamnose reductase
MRRKILILGSSGMAGHVITSYFREHSDSFDTSDVSRLNTLIQPSILLDVTNFERLERLIDTQLPDVIINCIGLLNQYAENNQAEAVLLNSYLPHFLESYTKDSSCKVIHISTDCVFSGKKGKYIENDGKDGIGFYAQSKSLGEIINKKDLTIRTSIIGPELNENGIGLFQWFSRQEGEIHGYSQALWSGITTIELAKAIFELINQNITGLFQLTNNTSISKYELMLIFKKEFINSNVSVITQETTYKVDKTLLNTRLDFNYTIPSYFQMVEDMKEWIKRNQKLYPHYQFLL